MEKGLGFKLVLGFVTLIVGLALIGSVADSSNGITALRSVSNESINTTTAFVPGGDVNESIVFTVEHEPTGWRITDCPISSFAMRNSTGDTLTVTTDYVVNVSYGTFNLVNTSSTNNTLLNVSYVDYNYCGTGYMNLGWGRTILKLIGGFFALAILLVSVSIFYSIGKDVGILSR